MLLPYFMFLNCQVTFETFLNALRASSIEPHGSFCLSFTLALLLYWLP